MCDDHRTTQSSGSSRWVRENVSLSHSSELSTHGKGWTGKTLLSFEKYFLKLPTEIRVRVWTYNVLEPRVIELEPNVYYDQIITRQKTPAYLQVCRESRYEGLKVYETLSAHSRYTYSPQTGWTTEKDVFTRILVNFEIDTIIFGSRITANHRAIHLIAGGTHIKHKKIRNLGIHYAACMQENSFNAEIIQCSALEKLYMVFDDYYSSGRYKIDPGYKRPEMKGTEIVIAGQHCVEYNVLEWHPDEDEMLSDFLFLGRCEVDRQRDNDEDEVTSFYEGDFGFSQRFGMVKSFFIDSDDMGIFDTETKKYIYMGVYALNFEELVALIKERTSKVKEIAAEINLALNPPISPSQSFWSLRRNRPRYTAEQIILKMPESIEKLETAHNKLAAARAGLVEWLEDIEYAFKDLSDRKKQEPRHRMNDFVYRYTHFRLQYHQERLGRRPNKRYNANDLQKKIRHEEHSRSFHPEWYVSGIEANIKRDLQARMKADPYSKAKRHIMSRRALGRRFTFGGGYHGVASGRRSGYVGGGGVVHGQVSIIMGVK